MPVREEIQQIYRLDNLIEHRSVSLGGGDGEPTRAASHPYPDLSIIMLTVGVVGDIFDDNAFRLVVVVEDCSW